MNIKSALKKLLLKYNRKKNFYYRILLFHDIQDMENFSKIIEFLSNNYNVIDYKKQNFKQDNNVLISFDDGFKSNYAASKILDKFNVKGIFFVNKSFVEYDKEKFSNIYREHEEDNSKDFKFMSVNDIKELNLNGHTIGSHTMSHKNLAFIEKEEIISQIKVNKVYLESTLEINIDNIAYPFGEITDINEIAMKIAFDYHPHVFSGVRGDNITNNKVFFREPVTEINTIEEIISILHGCYDFGYYFKQKRLLSYFKAINE